MDKHVFMLQMLTNSVVAGCAYALVAIGFSCIYRTGKSLHLAHAATYTTAAYLCYVSAIVLGTRWYVSATFAITGAAIIGAGMETFVYAPIRRLGASPLNTFLASLGLLVVVQNCLSLFFGDTSIAACSGDSAEVIRFGGVAIAEVRLWLVFVSALCCFAAWVLIRFSKFGKQIRAVGCDPQLAQAMGIRHGRVIFTVMIIGSSLAGIAAVFQAFDTSIYPMMGFTILLMAVVASVVGGIGSVRGAVLGCVLVGFAQNVAIWVLPSQWQDTVVFALLAVFLLCRPLGFFGLPVKGRQP